MALALVKGWAEGPCPGPPLGTQRKVAGNRWLALQYECKVVAKVSRAPTDINGMSTQSDVGFAIKAEAFQRLPAEVRAFLESPYFTTKLDNPEGKLFAAEWVKWNEEYGDPGTLYKALREVDDEDFRLIEACHDFPEHDLGDRGAWENPWDLQRNVEVSLTYEE